MGKVREDVGKGVGKCVGVWGSIGGGVEGVKKCVGVWEGVWSVWQEVWEVLGEVWRSVLGYGKGKVRCEERCGEVCREIEVWWRCGEVVVAV